MAEPEHTDRQDPEVPEAPREPRRWDFDRRSFVAALAALGGGGGGWRALAQAPSPELTANLEALPGAEHLAELEFTDEERRLLARGLPEFQESYRKLRQLRLPNEVAPAWHFDPLLGAGPDAALDDTAPAAGESRPRPFDVRDAKDELAFASVAELGRRLRAGEVTSAGLTELFLGRLRHHNETLFAVVNLLERRATRQAEAADRELAEGRDRGPLHGIPWGAKDLLAVAGAPTTWGAAPFKDQVLDRDAAVVRRLDEAGAVLVAKLSLGALAWGDVWYRERTRNPWNPEQGSSGSSAGSASATAAGLVPFALGSETLGSIVSPSTRCGTSGLRPTFGRVSRDGAMALSWTMDKVGPLCRSAEDCALVLAAIHGSGAGVSPATGDPALVDLPFRWLPPGEATPRTLRVGYAAELFEDPAEPQGSQEETEGDEVVSAEERAQRETFRVRAAAQRRFDRDTLETLRGLGCDLVPISLPGGGAEEAFPVEALSFILSAEAAAAFDEFTLSDRDDLLVRQEEYAWPNFFRQARLIPAVEYIQANRARTWLCRRMVESMAAVDLYVAPSFGGTNLLATNLTGHPAVVVPNGFHDDGTPGSISFVGRLFGEAKLLQGAALYQRATDFHRRRPPLYS